MQIKLQQSSTWENCGIHIQNVNKTKIIQLSLWNIIESTNTLMLFLFKPIIMHMCIQKQSVCGYTKELLFLKPFNRAKNNEEAFSHEAECMKVFYRRYVWLYG